MRGLGDLARRCLGIGQRPKGFLSHRRGLTPPHHLPLVERLEDRRLLAAVNPVISEFLANNKTGLRDSFGEASDWIEISNPDSRQSIDLANWKLQCDNDLWTFPAMTLGPGEYRVIFASGRNLTDPAKELHTNFALDKSGEDLRLLDPANNVVQEFAPYPAQQADISYGIGQQVTETKLVSAGDTARWLVPTNSSLGLSWIQPTFSDSSWAQGSTGLGFANLTPGFAATTYKASITGISSVAIAQSVIDTPSNQSWTNSETAPYINYMNTGGGGEFAANDRTFPGLVNGVDANYFVVKATGLVHIPTAGQWTFGVNSDDGFQLTVGGQSMAFDGLRGTSDTLSTFTFPAAGDYDLSLIFFENEGGSSLELFAAPGSKASFDSTFRLVGDTASGGLSIVSAPVTSGGSANSSLFSSQIRTNVKSAMQQANNASLYTRLAFDAPDLASLQTLTLKMAYDDGFVAWLNGTQVASRNAPSTPTWNSTATAQRASDFQAATYERIDITPYLGLLHPTGNVLAIQVMNASPTDGDLLLVPELSQILTTNLGPHYFALPTPGAPNTLDTWQPDIAFSQQHGIFSQPFQLTLSTTTPSASIYYTLDGSTPSPTHGTRYTGPINISTTTIIRAVSAVAGGQTGILSTETYLFLDSVINQSGLPAGWPTTWGTASADYAMDPRIMTDPAYRNTLSQDLLSIPTMSIVTDQSYLFDPTSGIYSNPMAEDLEKPASLEYFTADGSDGFQINAGLRIYGGVGRYPEFKKHSFRFIFNSQYGPSKLDFPLFGDDAADQFDSLTLRSNFNDAWVWGDQRTQLIRDQFANRTLLAMGQPAGHGTFVHLYINGVYWGLYNPVERPDTSFAATYLGGDKSEWTGTNAGEPINGTSMQPWYDLMSFFDNNDVTTAAGYQKLQGNNPDGTPNPAYPDLLDVNNYIDYLLMNFYGGNADWPGHNFYAARQLGPDSTGFKCFPWDTEMTLDGSWSSLGTDMTGVGSSANDIGKPYYYLRNNPDFRILFADHVQKFMFNGGALTPDATAARYKELADFVDAAIVTESARWGDVTGTLYTPANWANERDYLLNTYFPQRTAIVLQQLRNAGLFPSIDAPSFKLNGVAKYGGMFLPGDSLSITAPTGTIYYTLDGSDPRLPGGAVSPKALVYSGPITLTQGVEVRARLWSNNTWSALADASFYIDLAPRIRISEIMYNPAAPTPAEAAAGFTDNNDFEYIEITNTSNKTLPLSGLRFSDAVSFTFGNVSIAPNQSLLVVSNINAFKFRYPNVNQALIVGQYAGRLDNAGERVELDAPNGGIIHDFTYDNTWVPQTDGGGFSLTVRDLAQDLSLWDTSSGWRSSAAPLGSPGSTDTLPAPGTIVINEVLANPSASQQAAIELYNTTDQALPIGGWFLSDSSADLTKYQIAAGAVIPAHGYLVLTQTGNFASPTDPGARTPFWLSALGGDLYLSSNAAGLAGGYRDHVTIDPTPRGISIGRIAKSTGGSDFSLLQSPTFGETPDHQFTGAPNSIAYISPLVINEIMYHPAAPTPAEIAAGFTNADQFEFVELYNRSSQPLNLNDYYLGDGVDYNFADLADGGTQPSLTILAPGAYVVLVSNYAAFDARYHIAANNIPVAGAYTGNLNNGGEWLRLYQLNGDTPYELDRVNYSDHTPWPAAPDGDGPSLSRIHPAAYGNDLINWRAGNAAGTPGSANLPLDSSAPSIPTGLGFSATTAAITLTWSASTAPESAVNHYIIYRNGSPIGASTTTSFTDTTAVAPTRYSYQVSAVNRDGFESAPSTALTAAIPGIISIAVPDTTHVEILFTEPLTPATAFVLSNYSINGIAISAVALALGNAKVRLTTSTAMTAGGNYTLTARNLATASGNPLPSTLSTPFAATPAADSTPPTAPANLRGNLLSNNTQVTLRWDPSFDLESGLDHYIIYRDGSAYATSTTPTFTDTTAISSKSRHSYQISATNPSGGESARTPLLSIAPPGLASVSSPDANTVRVSFSEPLDRASAQTIANYSIPGIAITAAKLEPDNLTVTLTTSALGSSSRTLTASNIRTLDGLTLPAASDSFITSPPGWNVTVYKALSTATLGTLAAAQSVIDTPSNQAWVRSETAPTINYLNTDQRGHFAPDRTFPNMTIGVEVDNYVVQATAKIYIPTTGQWSFGVNSDDGFRFSIGGQSFLFDGGRGASDSFATFSLTAGYYDASLLFFQGVGGSSVEVFAESGNCQNAWNGGFRLIGDVANGGLAVGAAYAPAPFSVTVNPLGTGDPSPALTGIITDPSVGITLKLNNTFYAANNLGNGTWSLPRGIIQPALQAGAYSIRACAGNPIGQVAFDSSTNELLVDTTAPTAAILGPAPRGGALDSISIRFSEPITGLDLADLALTHDGSSDLITGAETLTTSDNITWTLSGLSPMTALPGAYTLSLNATASGIHDAGGNRLANSATGGWVNNLIDAPAAPVILSRDDNLIDISISGQYAYSFDSALQSAIYVHSASLTLDASQGTPAPAGGLVIDSPSLTLTGTADTDILIASAGQFQLNSSTISCASNIQLDSPTSVIPLASLTINNSATVSIRPGAGKVLRTAGLAISGTLDLADNALIVQAPPATAADILARISQSIASARNATPLWNGQGITTSQADDLHGLAAIRNADEQGKPLMGSFAGEAVDANSILVKLTLNGDADLNGILDGSDYFFIDKGFLSRNSANPPGGYRNGDFDYNGTIDGSDYFLIDKAFLSQRSSPLQSAPASYTAAPASHAVSHARKPSLLHRKPRRHR